MATATGAPTNNCTADFAASSSATDATTNNALLSEILTLPFGFDLGIGGNNNNNNNDDDRVVSSCSPSSTTNIYDAIGGLGAGGGAILDRMRELQRKAEVSSADLLPSLTVPNHPALPYASSVVESNAFSGTYRLSLPDAPTLLGAQFCACIGATFGVAFAAVLYRAVVVKKGEEERQRRSESSSSSSTTSTLLRRVLAGTVLLPLSLLLPYALVDAMDTNHAVLRFVLSILFVLYQFRILEAVCGFVPRGATKSLGVYCAYFSLPFRMIFDRDTHEPIMATKGDVWNGQVNFAKALASMVVLCSVLSPYDYAPFGASRAGEFHEEIVVWDYLDVRHLGNCFAIALFFQQALALGDCAFGSVIQIVFGYKVEQTMRNPMLEATSPSDFWGRRWNVLVHSVMKGGVYKPVRKHTSSAVLASLAVFVASGLFHEWLVHVVFLFGRPPSSSSRGVLLGSNAAFFVWNFVVIACERAVAGKGPVRSLGRMIPRMLVPFFIIMTSLPMAHWFGNPYLRGGFFGDYEMCLPLIRKV